MRRHFPERKVRCLAADHDHHRTVDIQLTERLTQDLASLADACQITLNIVLQGAWGLLLSVFSGTNDVVFGATRACRRTAATGMESTVGLFINSLPVRADAEFDFSWRVASGLPHAVGCHARSRADASFVGTELQRNSCR